MDRSEYTSGSEVAKSDFRFIPSPSIRIDVRNNPGLMSTTDKYFAASLTGLQALNCAGMTGYGSTEEEAVRNLRRQVLQYLDFTKSSEHQE